MTAFNDAKTIDDLLGSEPTPDVIATKAEIDPTALIDHAGQLKELGLDYGWGLTTVFERTIESIYLNTGYGWAGSIMLAAVAVRGATFFFQALSSDRMAALAALKPLTEPIQEKLTAAIARGDKQAEQMYKMQQAQVMAPHMGGMFSMGGFMIIQAWIGFSAFRCLRAMGALPVPGMANDGFFWFKDLTVNDPYYLIPAAITGIFYSLFKMGGETGVSAEAAGQQNAFRQSLMTGLAFFMGIVTSFQPAVLQLYFLTSGVLGAGTGYLLRQNWFRRLIHIRQLPSKQSAEIYSKVVKGEVSLSQIKGKDGKIRYQAPTAPTNRRSATTLPGIKIREGLTVPAHLKVEEPVKVSSERQDRDEDFEAGAQGTMLEKLSYYRRNYRLAYIYRRTQGSIERSLEKMGYGGIKTTEAQKKRKMRAEQYEIERRRRFENRK
ncbi:hypothetical protein SNOG_11202 [Parastagonospora nodorum SN15]|nr:hypothetical protein SNOG_11202 [Parastagonospora nodorum SN15]EAT81701.2 hypothetical protein SNOG_11202 [Parastagonospora nodorum SN15]